MESSIVGQLSSSKPAAWLPMRRPSPGMRAAKLPEAMSGVSMFAGLTRGMAGGRGEKRVASRFTPAAAGIDTRPRRGNTLSAPRAAVTVPSAVEPQPITVPSGFEMSLELVDFAAGCAGGCVGVTVGHPFDTIKVRMQQGGGGKANARGMLAQTLRTEGILGLAKGIETPLIGNVPVQAIVFGTYGALLRRIGAYYGDGQNGEEQPIWQHVLAGAGAGIFQTPAVTAAEYCKTQMQLQTETKSRKELKLSKGGAGRSTAALGGAGAPKVLYSSSIDCASYVIRHHGVAAVFRGLSITLIRDVTYGQWFGQYEWTKRLLMRGKEESPMFPIYSAMAGGAAGVCGWIIIFPVDTVKTRVQARQASEPTFKIMDCVRQMMKEEPMGRAFTRGLGVCLIRAVPVNAVTFLTYEAVMSLGQRLHEELP